MKLERERDYEEIDIGKIKNLIMSLFSFQQFFTIQTKREKTKEKKKSIVIMYNYLNWVNSKKTQFCLIVYSHNFSASKKREKEQKLSILRKPKKPNVIFFSFSLPTISHQPNREKNKERRIVDKTIIGSTPIDKATECKNDYYSK